MDRILAVILGIPVSVLVVIYRYQIVRLTGKFPWAEEKIGEGGTYTLLLFIGFGGCIFSLMYGLGTFQEFLEGTFGSFFT